MLQFLWISSHLQFHCENLSINGYIRMVQRPATANLECQVHKNRKSTKYKKPANIKVHNYGSKFVQWSTIVMFIV